MIQIDKGIPIPPKKGANAKYPWKEMEVGDSILIVGVSSPGVGGVIQSAKKICPGFRFCQRREGDNVRVWRTE